MNAILSQLIEARRDTVLTRYITYSALTVTTYDSVLTLFDTISLFRRSRTSLGRILYYLTRVVSFLGLGFMAYHASEFRPAFTRKACQIFIWIWPWLFSITMLSTDWLLTLRISALFHSRALVWRGAYVCLVLSGLVTFGLLIRLQLRYSKIIDYIEVIGLCGVFTQGRDVVNTFYPWLFHETVLTVIMGVHTWQSFKRGVGGPLFPLLTVLYRDGALFYLVILGIRIWLSYTLSTQPVTQLYLSICVMWAACTLLTTRAYLNLCSIVLVREDERETSMEMNASVGFTSHPRAAQAHSPTQPAFPRSSRPTPVRPTEVYFQRQTDISADDTKKGPSISPTPPLSPPSSLGVSDEERLFGTTSVYHHTTDDHTTA